MYIRNIRHDWPQKAGFNLCFPDGISQYTFLHFLTPVEINIGGTFVHAHAGACILYEPRAPKHYFSKGPLLSNWFRADASMRSLLEQYQIPVNCILYPKDTTYISDMFRAIEHEFFSDLPHRDTLINAYITEFVIRFSRSLNETTATTSLDKKERTKLRELRREVLSRPEEKWNIAKMSSMLSLSVPRFHTVYKAMFGTSPMRDVIDARVDLAKSLLLTNESMPLLEVAEILGYNDQYHFIRQFKSVTGITPGEYRKRNR